MFVSLLFYFIDRFKYVDILKIRGGKFQSDFERIATNFMGGQIEVFSVRTQKTVQGNKLRRENCLT
jgi:hypothetical protein